MSTDQLWLVLIETASNQRTIFQTNRLRENIGASELIHRVGTNYVLEALRKKASIASNPAALDSWLDDDQSNPHIESSKSEEAVEILVATSGKALLLTKSRPRAEQIVTEVTRLTLLNSPGVTARGAVVKVGSVAVNPGPPTARQLDDAIYEAHKRLDELGSRLPSNDRRFPRLPFVEDCASSAMPANEFWSHNKPFGPIGVSLSQRRQGYRRAQVRLLNALSGRRGKKGWPRLERNIEAIETKGYPWLAIVHADGNGLGKIFLNFADHVPTLPPGVGEFRHYINTLRRFSIGIDQCTRKAARVAIDQTWSGNNRMPFIPVVLGGDDLTVLCDGSKAIDFTVAFLRAFENETAHHDYVKSVARGGLSACAGIAIVKPHFPFHRAYELAESLIKEAKAVKEHATPCSAFDFQLLFDTSGAELDPIRKRMCAVEDASARLTFRPYVVTPLDAVPSNAWLEQHHFDRLRKAADALTQCSTDDEGRARDARLPRTQQHVLREAIHVSPDIADARLGEIKHRYGASPNAFDWDTLLHGTGSLFHNAELEDGGQIRRTYLLDAMDLADLDGEVGQ